jgi:hypothetical protein
MDKPNPPCLLAVTGKEKEEIKIPNTKKFGTERS